MIAGGGDSRYGIAQIVTDIDAVITGSAPPIFDADSFSYQRATLGPSQIGDIGAQRDSAGLLPVRGYGKGEISGEGDPPITAPRAFLCLSVSCMLHLA